MENKTFPSLYAVAKTGKVLKFTIEVNSNELGHGEITQETGQVGGKMTPRGRTITKGKNIGKANETTPYEQACLEAESDWNKKLKEGYKTLQWLINKKGVDITSQGKLMHEDDYAKILFKELNITHNTDHNDRTKPMLADKWKKHKTRVNYPVLVQPKYNGVRCKLLIENGKPILLSREGEVYSVPHITDYFNSLKIARLGRDSVFVSELMASTGTELDGEIYLHGKALQDIVHLIKTPSLLSTELYYVVYDTASKYEQDQRIKDRDNLLLTVGVDTPIRKSKERFCYNEKDVMEYFAECRKEGYEGSIVRQQNTKYYFGFRDKALLKIKETMSAEFRIIGTNFAKDDAPDEDFVWKCETPEGLHFEVKPHGTVAERINQYENRNDYIGKNLQLEFHEYTKDKIPFHITSVTVRDYE